MPEQPPPLTPSRTPLAGVDCARLDSCALICCAARVVTLTDNSATLLLVLLRDRPCRDPLLLLPVGDGRLDGVLRQHRAVDLHGRQRQLLGDLLVGDLDRLVDRLALHPLGDERRRGDGRSAPESLELRVLDLAVVGDAHLQPHHIAARGRADEAGPDVRVALVHRPHVARVLVVVQHFVAVCHVHLTGDTKARAAPRPSCPRQWAAHSILDRSMPSFAISYSGLISRSLATCPTTYVLT